MRLTVLGNTGRYLAPFTGGSAYLLEGGGARVLLDAGGGAAAALADLVGRDAPPALDAIVLSHFHFDHVIDLPMLREAMGPQTRVFIPPGERRRLDALAAAYVFEGAWDSPSPVVEGLAGAIHVVGGLMLSFAPTQHSAPAMATRIEGPTGVLVYASDGAPCPALADLARNTDMLLMHALLPTVEAGSDHARVHATAETAARLAIEARANTVLLSHRFHESEDAAMRRAASAHPHVELARDRHAYAVKGPGS